MLELGDDSDDEHRAVVQLAAQLGIDEIVAVGEAARVMGAPHWVPDIEAAFDHIEATVRRGDVVLVKASRDSGLRWLGDRLAQTAPPTSPTTGEVVAQ